MKSKKLVSIIVPTHNCNLDRFRESLNSIFGQTYGNIELVIVDDCSNIDVKPLINKYQNRGINIIYLRNKYNLGCTKSLNVGVKASHGYYIARIDDDDIWNNNDKLEKQISFLEENPEYGLIGVERIIIINESGEKINSIKNRITDSDIRNHLLQTNQFAHSSILFKRDDFDKIGGYNEKYLAAQDYEFICRMGLNNKFMNLKGLSISYRVNTKGISKTRHGLQYKNSWKTFLKNRNNYPNFLKALVLRCGEFLLPQSITEFIMKIVKKF